jgi:hypothetical protein
MGYLGPTPMEFVAPGGIRVATADAPADSYPGTDFNSAFFTVSINPHLTAAECERFTDSPLATQNLVAPKEQPVKKINGVEFHGVGLGFGGLGHQFSGAYYHGFSRGSCYELGYGMATSGYGAVDDMKQVDHGKVSTILEKILSTVAIHSPTTSDAVDSPSNAAGLPPRKPDTPAMAQWKALIPSIQGVLTHTSGFDCPGHREDIGIVDAADITGESTSYALVDFCQGGAYTDWIVAMQLEAGQPVPAHFRRGNKVIDLGFAQGASVMNAVDVKLVPKKKAIYDLFSGNDAKGHLAKCGANAYVWNASARTFDWNVRLTKQAKRSYCHSAQLLLQQH